MRLRCILVRLDDICPTMDIVQFRSAVSLLDRYSIKPLLGIIPYNRDQELFCDKPHRNYNQLINEFSSKGYSFAMHGYHHTCEGSSTNLAVINRRSEFLGEEYSTQVDKIRKGKEKLSEMNISTDTFIAPFHSYDEVTIKALAECGFKYMSDGKSMLPYNWHGIDCIPCRSYGCPKMVLFGHYTAVFHPNEWTRPEKHADYLEFCQFIKKYHSIIVPWEEYIRQPVTARWIGFLSEKSWVFVDVKLRPIASKLKHFISKIFFGGGSSSVCV